MSVYAVALDPGGTTGIAIVKDSSQPWNLSVGELTGEHYRKLFRYLGVLQPMYLICETFENRGQSAAVLTSKEYIGVVKLYLQRSDTHGIWQSASTGKAFWSDDMLRRYNLYVKGLRHARDAIRHYAAWRTFTIGDRDLLEGRQKAEVRSAVFRSYEQ